MLCMFTCHTALLIHTSLSLSISPLISCFSTSSTSSLSRPHSSTVCGARIVICVQLQSRARCAPSSHPLSGRVSVCHRKEFNFSFIFFFTLFFLFAFALTTYRVRYVFIRLLSLSLSQFRLCFSLSFLLWCAFLFVVVAAV